jgi:hypothetical protein
MSLVPVAFQAAGWGSAGERTGPAGLEERDRFDAALWAAFSAPRTGFLLASELLFAGSTDSSVGNTDSARDDPGTSGKDRTSSESPPGPARESAKAPRESADSSRPGRGAAPTSRPAGNGAAGRAAAQNGDALPASYGKTATADGAANKPSEGDTAALHSAQVQGRGQETGVRVDPALTGLSFGSLAQRLGGARATAPPRRAPGSWSSQSGKLPGTPNRSTGTILVPFKDAQGLEGRIRLALRGTALLATILTPSRETVQRLGSEIGDLQRALTEHGFAGAQVTVRQTRVADPTDLRPDSWEDPARHRENQGDGGEESTDDRSRSNSREGKSS